MAFISKLYSLVENQAVRSNDMKVCNHLTFSDLYFNRGRQFFQLGP